MEEQASAEVARAGREVLKRLKGSNRTVLSAPSRYGRAVSVSRLGRGNKARVAKTVTVRVGSGLQGVGAFRSGDPDGCLGESRELH